MGRVGAFARVLHMLVLGVWAGAGAYHLLVVVPAAFAAFASKHDALEFLGRSAAELDRGGMVAGPVVLLSLLIGWVGQGRPMALRTLGALLLSGGAMAGGLWLGPAISTLEAALLAGESVTESLDRLYTAADGVLIAVVVIALLMLLTTPLGSASRAGSRIELGVRP